MISAEFFRTCKTLLHGNSHSTNKPLTQRNPGLPVALAIKQVHHLL